MVVASAWSCSLFPLLVLVLQAPRLPLCSLSLAPSRSPLVPLNRSQSPSLPVSFASNLRVSMSTLLQIGHRAPPSLSFSRIPTYYYYYADDDDNNSISVRHSNDDNSSGKRKNNGDDAPPFRSSLAASCAPSSRF